MAPRKRKAEEDKEPAAEAEAEAVASSPSLARVTRSTARRASASNKGGAAAEPLAQLATKKRSGKGKVPEKKEKNPKKVESEDGNGNGASEIVDDETVTKTTTIVIEHCTQCRSFRRRAEEAKAGLEKGVSGITVLFNPEKPRRGCFEIRGEGGEIFITLLNLKRPFKPMKDLNMDKVVGDIIQKIK